MLVASLACVTRFARGQVEFDGRLPISKGKLVYRFSPDLGYSQRSFLERYQGDLFLDPTLGTLRFFSPTRGVQLYRPGDAGKVDLVYLVLRFIRENRDVFKINTETLLLSGEYEIDEGHYLLIFRQAAGEVPICGAAVRVVVSGRESPEGPGLLKSIKAFVVEEASPTQTFFAPEYTVEDVLASVCMEMTSTEKQCYFPRYDAASITPVWYAR